jgi:Zn-dependent peptidase ImmA (M78 family)
VRACPVQQGFATFWAPQIFGHDTLTVLAVVGREVPRIELGQRQLDALELAQLAETLGRSVEWFLTEPPAAIASRRDGLSPDQNVRLLEEELEHIGRDVELLTDVHALSLQGTTVQAGVTTLSEAEAGAQEARTALGMGDGPVLDLQKAVERLGLLAFSLELGPSVIDGGYVRIGEVGVALVNGAADAGRRRFNLAHELGHHVLADEYTPDFGLSATRDDRESLINAFAAHFLLPATSVRRRWAELAGEHEGARERLIVLAAEYRVSWSAAISHATTLELIDHAEFAALQSRRPTGADYFELGVRFTEELQPVALAPAYSRAAIRAYRRGLISADRAVELLRDTITREELPRPHEAPVEALAPGIAATLAPPIYDLLADDLGFEGVVITDSLGMQAVLGQTDPPPVTALLAGADLLLMPVDTARAHRLLSTAIENGDVPRERILDAAASVVALQLWQQRVAEEVAVPDDVRERAAEAAAVLARGGG